MAGEDTVLRLIAGEPTVVSLEDTTHTYAIDVGTVNVGDVVFQSTTVDEKVAQADADNSAARPPIGVCLSLPTTTTAVVVHAGGIVTGLTGLTRGSAYWLSTTPGAVTTTRPSTNAFIVGVALSATSFLVTCIPADIAPTATLQTAYGNGATITTASAVDIAFTTTSGNFVVNGPGLVDLGSAGTDLSAFNVGTGTLTLAATGAVLVNSSGGSIGIGTAADAQAINIGTGAAARTITVGNSTGASAVNLTAGSGGITLTATTTSVTGDLLVQGTDIRNDLLESFRWDALSAGTIPSTLGTSNGGAGAETVSATNGVTVSGATGTSMATASRFVSTGARPWRYAGCYRETHESDAPVGLGGYTNVAGEPVYCLSRVRGGGWQLWQDNGSPGVFVKIGGVLAYPDAPWVQVVVPGSGAGATDVHWQISESGQDGTWTTIHTQNFDIENFTAWITTPGTTMQVLRYITPTSGTNGWNLVQGMSSGTAATTLQAGTGAMTLTAGGIFDVNATGAVTVDGTGISIDGTSASNLSTTAANLTLSTITSGILAVTSAGALNLSSTTGDWQASGALTIDSSGGAISIGSDANAQAINIGTGAAARTITIGNVTTTTSLVLNAGTGAINIGTTAQARSTNIATGAAVQTVTVGSTNTTSSVAINSGSGDITMNANAGTIFLQLSGVTEATLSTVGLDIVSGDKVTFGGTGSSTYVQGLTTQLIISSGGAITIAGAGALALDPGASSVDDIAIQSNGTIYAKFDSGQSGLSIGGDFTVASSAMDIRTATTGTAIGSYAVQFVSTGTSETTHSVLRLAIGEAALETSDIFISGYQNDVGTALGTKVFTLNGAGALTTPFTGQHYIVFDVSSEGTSMFAETAYGLIVESTGVVWNEVSIDDAYLHAVPSTTNASKKVFGVVTELAVADLDLGLWGEFSGVFNVGSAPARTTLAAAFTFNGTTTVTATDTSEVVAGQFIWMDGDFHWFRIVEVVDSTTLLIDAQGNPIPTGSSTVQCTDANDPCTTYSSSSRYFKGRVNSLGEGLIWVTTFGGEPNNGDYICSSEVIISGKAGYGQKQTDDILRASTIAKMTEQVDWSAVTDTFDWSSVTYKKKLVACTYHCG